MKQFFRWYDYYTYATNDEYGQPILSPEVKGKIHMWLNVVSQSTIDNPLYENSTYIGITTDDEVNSTYVIQNGEERLKVLYVNQLGRCKQVYLARC